jgi:hypothetical protein
MVSILWTSAHVFDTLTHGLNDIFVLDYYRNYGSKNSKFERIEVGAVEN